MFEDQAGLIVTHKDFDSIFYLRRGGRIVKCGNVVQSALMLSVVLRLKIRKAYLFID